MYRNYYVFLLSLGCALSLSAQQDSIQVKIDQYFERIATSRTGERLLFMDSLMSAVKFNKELKYDSLAMATIDYAIEIDSIVLATDHISDLIYYYKSYEANPHKSIELFEKYKFIHSKTQKDDLARMHLNAGNAFDDMGERNSAISMYEIARSLAAEIGHNRFVGLADMYIGQSLSLKGQFAEASKVLKQANSYFRKENDTLNMIAASNSLSILYSQTGFYEEAEVVRDEGAKLARLTNELSYLVTLNYNAATDFRKTKEHQKQIQSLLNAFEASKKSPYKRFTHIPVMTALVRAYSDVGNISEAKKYLDSLERHPETTKEPHFQSSYHWAQANYYKATGAYPKALEFGVANLELRRQDQNYEDQLNAEKFLAEVYELTGDHRNALKHLKNFNTLNDSINSAQKVKGLLYYQTLYETEKRDFKIKTQESDLALLEQKNREKNQWLLFGGLGLISIFGFFILYKSRNNYRKQQRLLVKFSQDLMNAQEEERTRVAKDLHDSVGQQLTLIKKKAQNIDQLELATMTSKTLDEVRNISRGLYPPMLKKLGLSKSINQTLFELDEETELFISSEVDPEIDSSFSEEETLSFYRFIQEAVNNVIKHSAASTLEVKILKEKDKVKTLIRDNGIGFNDIQKLTQNSLGLKTMTERINALGGKLFIKSQRGEGTWLIAEITK